MKIRNQIKKYGAHVKSGYGKAAAVVGSALFSGMAMAQSAGLGADALTEVSAIKSDVSAILKVLVGVVFLLVAWMYLKRAK